MELKSKHLWKVVDFWEDTEPLESIESNSQRWVIKAMVDDLRAMEAEIATQISIAGEHWATIGTLLSAIDLPNPDIAISASIMDALWRARHHYQEEDSEDRDRADWYLPAIEWLKACRRKGSEGEATNGE